MTPAGFASSAGANPGRWSAGSLVLIGGKSGTGLNLKGRMLRQIAQPDGALGRIRRAVGWIRDNHRTRLRIDALCYVNGMSRASLHRHFLAMTGLSPLQYQKQLRLQEARQLLLAGEHGASGAAFAVGYESASQFSREYLRQFGAPPARDVLRIREAIAIPSVTQIAKPIPAWG